MAPELETLKRMHEAATPGVWIVSGKSIHIQPQETYSPTDLRGGAIANFIGNGWSKAKGDPTNKQATANAEWATVMHNVSDELNALLEAVEVLCNPPKDCPATCLDQMAVVRDCNEWLRAKLREVKP